MTSEEPFRKLPDDFKEMVDRLVKLEPRVDGLIESLSRQNPVVAVRVNPGKQHPEIVDMPGVMPVKWWQGGVYLPERPAFTLDPALHQGRYYVQDASSMFVAHIIKELTRDLESPVAFLDACAAPGGKTTAAIDALPAGSLVVANEFDFRRADILNENLCKWGYPSVVVTRGDTALFRKLPAMFDIIAADVPCSGEGMMRKEDEAVTQWSAALVDRCATRQREIVDNLWGALSPGGYFIYSTCTFNRSEDEEIVEYLIDNHDAESIPIPGIELFPEIVGAIGNPRIHAARFLPHLTCGEGIFMALLRKRGENPVRKSQKPRKTSKLPFRLPEWFPSALVPEIEGDTLRAVPAQWLDSIKVLEKHLNVIRAGVDVAVIKGRDLIPSQGVAMLAGAPVNADRVEIDRETALRYLRREPILLPDETRRGNVLVTYQDTPLGWMKNLGNRANNLYPVNWRIRNL